MTQSWRVMGRTSRTHHWTQPIKSCKSDVMCLANTSAPYPATLQESRDGQTYREIDRDLVQLGVVGHDGPLHLPAQVGDVDSLARHQVGEVGQPSKAWPDQVSFLKFTNFPAIVEPDRVAVFSQSVRLTSLDGLDDGRIKSAVLARSNNSRAQNWTFCQSFSSGHCVLWYFHCCSCTKLFV